MGDSQEVESERDLKRKLKETKKKLKEYEREQNVKKHYFAKKPGYGLKSAIADTLSSVIALVDLAAMLVVSIPCVLVLYYGWKFINSLPLGSLSPFIFLSLPKVKYEMLVTSEQLNDTNQESLPAGDVEKNITEL